MFFVCNAEREWGIWNLNLKIENDFSGFHRNSYSTSEFVFKMEFGIRNSDVWFFFLKVLEFGRDSCNSGGPMTTIPAAVQLLLFENGLSGVRWHVACSLVSLPHTPKGLSFIGINRHCVAGRDPRAPSKQIRNQLANTQHATVRQTDQFRITSNTFFRESLSLVHRSCENHGRIPRL